MYGQLLWWDWFGVKYCQLYYIVVLWVVFFVKLVRDFWYVGLGMVEERLVCGKLDIKKVVDYQYVEYGS